jgi:hypothetical protein
MIAFFIPCLLPAALLLSALPIVLLGWRPKGTQVAPRARARRGDALSSSGRRAWRTQRSAFKGKLHELIERVVEVSKRRIAAPPP